MNVTVEMAERMLNAALAAEELPSREFIREILDAIAPGWSDADREALARKAEERHDVRMELGSVLQEDDHEPWLDAARANIDPYYWDRYRQLLVVQGLSGQVVAKLDEVTNRILGLMENPHKDGEWDRRGMVVGHVQSGKTSNYIGLLCKAADAGYRLIIVIAGIHNKLRNQTQRRIDEGFTGYDSGKVLARGQRSHGVARFDSRHRPVTFTNSVKDFNVQTATTVGMPLENLKQPALFVIKKNVHTLRNLIDWLRQHNAKAGRDVVTAPMLLIDDEADNASINISRGPNEVSRINGLIRALMQTSTRSCYVGYTATPFANIFIDPASEDEMVGADLFPRDFIISLDPPTNYIGPVRVFGADSGVADADDVDNADRPTVVRYIDDSEDLLPSTHKKEQKILGLPPSLKDAVRTFVLAKAIRVARGHRVKHTSMLVNASRFIDVQAQLRNELHAYIDVLASSVRVNGSLALGDAVKDPNIAALHATWCREYESATAVSWEQLQALLHEAIAPIRVVEINSRSSAALDYDQFPHGLNVIAVGGFSLSRGLTLEGLMVSYFLRNSKMYDTLMQMGRWFGYRPDYADLCRIWMPEEACGWYQHITESVEELRDDLRRMGAAGATPKEFGLKVRSHPDSLIVTARNKMGSGERFHLKISLANRYIETTVLRRDPQSLEINRRAARDFADALTPGESLAERAESVAGGWLVRDVSAQPVIRFLSEYRNDEQSYATDSGPVCTYIRHRLDSGLGRWDVMFTSLSRPVAGGLSDSSLGIPILCQRRSIGDRSDAASFHFAKQRVATRGIEKSGLGPDEVALAESTYLGKRRDAGQTVNFPDKAYREFRRRPLLVVMLLAMGSKSDNLLGKQPVVAWGISFPKSSGAEETVDYVVNTTWMKEQYAKEADDEDPDEE